LENGQHERYEKIKYDVALMPPLCHDLRMKPKVYIETTIPSYLVGRPSRDLIVAAHQELTHEWWQTRQDNFDIFISQFVIDEASLGDPVLSRQRLKIIRNLAQLNITQDVEILATEIVLSGAVPEKASTDAAHIASASVHAMDYLLTWNCTHIANAEIYKKVQTVCKAKGFTCPIICTPEELMGVNNNEI
jgi:hypothetical protein